VLVANGTYMFGNILASAELGIRVRQ